MTRLLKILKWIVIVVATIIIVGISYLRFSRFSDSMIYHVNGLEYSEFKSDFNHEEFYFDITEDTKIHAALFKPDSIPTIGTIFHFSGKGMHLMSVQKSYQPLLNKGFQIFCYERRDFGKSTGKAENSKTIQADALVMFDKIAALPNVKEKPILIWGQSLGGAFATMTANKRQDKIRGLFLEGTFSSFPDIGKEYARALHLENFKWVVPLVMNNDFPAEEEIKNINIPIVVAHSKIDKQVRYELGKKLYKNAPKNNSVFWDINGKHIRGIYNHENEYVNHFLKMIQ
ncbi:alpha/beta hydrolase [uncultured Tenacibaculum sp.]|uniref:alpha/beta hydrolase n=1 Tax=uncultured Tenacibaculum sp. TaxID=174713 RepID=UPI00262FE069|nr:alpha/beta hydrolase [uncultured Tenacibaculum sp.]